jgi:phosphate transport system protein
MERHFDEELKELHKVILEMAAMAQEAIRNSIGALKNCQKQEAQNVINADDEIDKLELIIDEKCIDLIARYQPVYCNWYEDKCRA